MSGTGIAVRVHFYVHGANEGDLLRQAVSVLAKFSHHEDWELNITALAERINQDGSVMLWRGDVEAERPEIKVNG